MPAASAAPPSTNRPLVQELRQAIRRLEGYHPEREERCRLLPFGIEGIDAALGGGLPRAALHEIAAPSEADLPAAAGFALALAAAQSRMGTASESAASNGAVLWIAEDMSRLETGLPYGPGLDELGLAPEAVLTVAAACAQDVLWAMEEALRCRAVAAVIGEIRKPPDGRAASRRLSLAAGREQAMALLLCAQPGPRGGSASSRWMVGATRSAPHPSGPGPPAFAVQLVRNRFGRLGAWVLEWNRVEQWFNLAATHSQPVAETALDRPRDAARVA